jgi:hypothetical protein
MKGEGGRGKSEGGNEDGEEHRTTPAKRVAESSRGSQTPGRRAGRAVLPPAKRVAEPWGSGSDRTFTAELRIELLLILQVKLSRIAQMLDRFCRGLK